MLGLTHSWASRRRCKQRQNEWQCGWWCGWFSDWIWHWQCCTLSHCKWMEGQVSLDRELMQAVMKKEEEQKMTCFWKRTKDKTCQNKRNFHCNAFWKPEESTLIIAPMRLPRSLNKSLTCFGTNSTMPTKDHWPTQQTHIFPPKHFSCWRHTEDKHDADLVRTTHQTNTQHWLFNAKANNGTHPPPKPPDLKLTFFLHGNKSQQLQTLWTILSHLF